MNTVSATNVLKSDDVTATFLAKLGTIAGHHPADAIRADEMHAPRDAGSPETIAIREEDIHAWVGLTDLRLLRLLRFLEDNAPAIAILREFVCEEGARFRALLDQAAIIPDLLHEILAVANTYQPPMKVTVTTEVAMSPDVPSAAECPDAIPVRFVRNRAS